MADIQFQNNLHNLSRNVCELEAKFHTLWLRLLELSIYIDQNIKTNVNKRVTTEMCHDTCSNNTRHDVLHQNYGNNYLSEFNTKQVSLFMLLFPMFYMCTFLIECLQITLSLLLLM